jgi:hypothetical protein
LKKVAHDPIPESQRRMMNTMAQALDEAFNGDVRPKKVGFALLIYNLGEQLEGTGRINYIGNGRRDEVLTALKELVARWEGRYSKTDTTQ